MIHIFGGGTVMHVRSHFAVCAPAYGSTAKALAFRIQDLQVRASVMLHLTRMAGGWLETNDDVEAALREVLGQQSTKAIVFNVALCDFEGAIGDVPSGRHAPRLQSREGVQQLRLTPAKKLLGLVKTMRPDVCLVGFKTTADATVDEQLAAARRQIQETGADYVFANDVVTRMNILVQPDNQRQGDREELLAHLAKTLIQGEA